MGPPDDLNHPPQSATGSNGRTPAERHWREKFAPSKKDILQAHEIYTHIHETWPRLTFDHADLFHGGADNPLLPHRTGEPFYIYISEKENRAAVQKFYDNIRQTLLDKGWPPEILLDLEVRTIPRGKDGRLNIPYNQHGLLHIPRRAVSPGLHRYTKGALYYWDTSFMIRGMVQDGMADLAFDMLENLFYQIEHYNGPLNANLSVYLSDKKPRSQLPLLASKILIIYNNWSELSAPPEDRTEWLKRAAVLAEQHYQHWVTGKHLHEESGLSMFNTSHSRPGVEVLHAESGHYLHAYNTLREMWERRQSLDTPVKERRYQDRKDLYYISLYLQFGEDGRPMPFQVDPQTGAIQGLTEAFFRGDWAMRESGFDPSRRFGFLNVDIIHHLPVCLNSFRYKMEEELAHICEILAERDPAGAAYWHKKKNEWEVRAENTCRAMQKYLWDGLDDPAPEGRWRAPDDPDDPLYPCFRDRNINPELAETYGISPFRHYNFAACAFAPLWVGAATEEQAETILRYTYPLLKTPYGLHTSTRQTGCQWDSPMIWAPLQIIAVEGLERYDYYYTALELAQSYVHAVEREYERTGCLYEKLEGLNGTSDTRHYTDSDIGYGENDTGFGWTITAYVELKIAIERLKRKIEGRPLDGPNVTTNFGVKNIGKARPPKDKPKK